MDGADAVTGADAVCCWRKDSSRGLARRGAKAHAAGVPATFAIHRWLLEAGSPASPATTPETRASQISRRSSRTLAIASYAALCETRLTLHCCNACSSGGRCRYLLRSGRCIECDTNLVAKGGNAVGVSPHALAPQTRFAIFASLRVTRIPAIAWDDLRNFNQRLLTADLIRQSRNGQRPRWA